MSWNTLTHGDLGECSRAPRRRRTRRRARCGRSRRIFRLCRLRPRLGRAFVVPIEYLANHPRAVTHSLVLQRWALLYSWVSRRSCASCRGWRGALRRHALGTRRCTSRATSHTSYVTMLLRAVFRLRADRHDFIVDRGRGIIVEGLGRIGGFRRSRWRRSRRVAVLKAYVRLSVPAKGKKRSCSASAPRARRSGRSRAVNAQRGRVTFNWTVFVSGRPMAQFRHAEHDHARQERDYRPRATALSPMLDGGLSALSAARGNADATMEKEPTEGARSDVGNSPGDGGYRWFAELLRSTASARARMREVNRHAVHRPDAATQAVPAKAHCRDGPGAAMAAVPP